VRKLKDDVIFAERDESDRDNSTNFGRPYSTAFVLPTHFSIFALTFYTLYNLCSGQVCIKQR